MTPLWQNWLRLWGWGVIIFGAVLAGAGFAASDGVAMTLLELMGPMPATVDSAHRFAIGLMGAVTMGWGLTFLAFFRLTSANDVSAETASAWRLMLGGFILWYVVDSSISIATGFALNAVSNTLLLALLAVPVFGSGVLRSR